MSATERRRFVDQIRFNINCTCLIRVGTEFMRRNAKKIEKISVEQRIHPELVRFKGGIGNLIAPQRPGRRFPGLLRLRLCNAPKNHR